MRLIPKRYDPNASQPANFEGHYNIEECWHEGVLGRCIFPEYIVEALEKNKDVWRTTHRASHCTHCRAHFIGLTIVVPIEWWGPTQTAFAIYNYGWRVDGT